MSGYEVLAGTEMALILIVVTRPDCQCARGAHQESPVRTDMTGVSLRRSGSDPQGLPAIRRAGGFLRAEAAHRYRGAALIRAQVPVDQRFSERESGPDANSKAHANGRSHPTSPGRGCA